MSVRKLFHVVFFLVLSISLVIGCREEKTAEIFVKGASISGANGVMFDSENQLYIASVVGRSITVMNRETGEIIRRIGPDVGVEGPDDLIFGPDGSLYWTSFLTGEVGRLGLDGNVQTQFVKPGVNPITFSEDGRLFVALDFIGDALYELDPELEAPPRLLMESLGFLNGFDFGPDGLLYGPIWTQGKIVRIDVDRDPPTVETVAEGFSIPSAVKFNSQGELYVTDHMESTVIHVNVETGEKEVIATGLHKADNLAFDSDDRLFVSSADDGFIGEVLNDGTVRTVNPGGMMFLGGITMQSAPEGNSLFVADLFNLREIDPLSGEEISSQKSYLCKPGITSAMTVAGDGENLIVTSWFARMVQIWNHENREVIEEYPDFGIPINAIRFQSDLIVAELTTTSLIRANGENPQERTTLASDLAMPAGLAADEENLWVGDWITGKIYQVIKDGSVLSELQQVASGLSNPEGMILGADKNLLVVEAGAGRVVSVNLKTGTVTTLIEDLELGLPAVPGMPPTWILSDITQAPDGTLFITGDQGHILYRAK